MTDGTAKIVLQTQKLVKSGYQVEEMLQMTEDIRPRNRKDGDNNNAQAPIYDSQQPALSDCYNFLCSIPFHRTAREAQQPIDNGIDRDR